MLSEWRYNEDELHVDVRIPMVLSNDIDPRDVQCTSPGFFSTSTWKIVKEKTGWFACATLNCRGLEATRYECDLIMRHSQLGVHKSVKLTLVRDSFVSVLPKTLVFCPKAEDGFEANAIVKLNVKKGNEAIMSDAEASLGSERLDVKFKRIGPNIYRLALSLQQGTLLKSGETVSLDVFTSDGPVHIDAAVVFAQRL